jgi:hypothetical protein
MTLVGKWLKEVSQAVWFGAPLEMNGGLKEGLEQKRPGKLKCDGRAAWAPLIEKKDELSARFV